MRKQRRIVLCDATGKNIQGKSIDVSDVDHTNSRASMCVAVEELCDLGHWHTLSGGYMLPPWGGALTDPYANFPYANYGYPVCIMGHPTSESGDHIKAKDALAHG